MASGQGTAAPGKKKEMVDYDWPWMKNPVGAREIMMKEVAEEIIRERNGFRDYPTTPTPPPSPAEPVRVIWKEVYEPVTKGPGALEDFFRILERTMDHPVVKPEFRYKTYYDHYDAFSATRLRPYDIFHSTPALKSVPRPKLEIGRSFPSHAGRIADECEDETKDEIYTHLTSKSHLITCPQTAYYAAKHFQLILNTFKKLESRARKIRAGGQGDYDYGLAQLGGFAREINKIAEYALVGTRLFTLTASLGFVPVLDLLRNPKALLLLRKVSVNLVDKLPREDDMVTGRIKMQASLDTVLASYRLIGHPGFCGNWTDIRRSDPEVLDPDEMELVFLCLVNAFKKMCALGPDLVEVYRTIIYSDNVEKTYLINYLRMFPVGDQIKFLKNLEVLNGRIRHVHQLLSRIDTITRRLDNLYAPPPPRLRSAWQDAPIVGPERRYGRFRMD